MKRLNAKNIERLENTSIASSLVALATADGAAAAELDVCAGDTCGALTCVANSLNETCKDETIVCEQETACNVASCVLNSCYADTNCEVESVCREDSLCAAATDEVVLTGDYGVVDDVVDAVRNAIRGGAA